MSIRLKQIAEGWRNHLFPPEELKDIIKEVSEERLKICRACPFSSDNAKKDGYSTIRMDFHCTKCGCPLTAKTKSLQDECPEKFWEAIKNKTEDNETNEERNTEDD